MSPMDPWFEDVFTVFTVLFVIMTAVRIGQTYEVLKIAEAQKQDLALRKDASSTRLADNTKRVEAVQHTQATLHQQATEILREIQETKEQLSAVLSRLEAIADKVQR
jgi:predicted acylesterase/phospholipase RssA